MAFCSCFVSLVSCLPSCPDWWHYFCYLWSLNIVLAQGTISTEQKPIDSSFRLQNSTGEPLLTRVDKTDSKFCCFNMLDSVETDYTGSHQWPVNQDNDFPLTYPSLMYVCLWLEGGGVSFFLWEKEMLVHDWMIGVNILAICFFYFRFHKERLQWKRD